MKKSAFTLIELFIVIVNVAVIVSLTFVGLNSVLGKSRDGKRLVDIRKLQASLILAHHDKIKITSDFIRGFLF